MNLFMKALYLTLDDEHGIPVAAWDALGTVADLDDRLWVWRALDRDVRIVEDRVYLPRDSMVRMWVSEKLDG